MRTFSDVLKGLNLPPDDVPQARTSSVAAAPAVPAPPKAAPTELLPQKIPPQPAVQPRGEKVGKPKSSVLSVRVTPEQRAAVEGAAITEGVTVSAYIAKALARATGGKPSAGATVNTHVNQHVYSQSAQQTAAVNRVEAERVARVVLSDPTVLDELRRIGVNINQIAHTINSGLPPDVQRLAEQFRHLLDALTDAPEFRRRLEALKHRQDQHAPAHPSTRHVIQGREPVHLPRPAEPQQRAGFLGFLRKP